MARRQQSRPGTIPGKRRAPSQPSLALALAGVRPAKSRGQNFLVQGAVADRIVEAAELRRDDQVVEIGPGLGILTERILARDVASVLLVELDRALAARLRSVFGHDRRLSITDADFLSVDLSALVTRPPAKFLGNLPFNVASAILRKLCSHHSLVAAAVLMFQREVAERLRAAPREPAYSALSVFTAFYFKIDLHFTVEAGSFYPRPRVDAEVVRLRPREKLLFRRDEEALVLKTVRAAFSAPRKMIRNSLARGLELDGDAAARILARAEIDPSTRAQSLSPEDLVRLARAVGGAAGAHA